MTIQKKLSFTLITLIIVLCGIITYVMNSALRYVLLSEEYNTTQQTLSKVDNALLRNIIIRGENEQYFIKSKKILQEYAERIQTTYTPNLTKSPSLDALISSIKKQNIQASIVSTTGDTIIDFTPKASSQLFTQETYPPLDKNTIQKQSQYTFLLDSSKEQGLILAYITPFIGYNALIVTRQRVSVSSLITPLAVESAIVMIKPEYTNTQIISEQSLQAQSSLNEKNLLALEHFIKTKQRNYIDSSSAMLYSIGYNPLLHVYIIVQKDIAGIQNRIHTFTNYTTNICIAFALLALVFLPFFVKIFLHPIRGLTHFMQHFSKNPEMQSEIDILAIETALANSKNNEFRSMAESFVHLLQAFTFTKQASNAISTENTQFSDEFEIAQAIQQGLLPNTQEYKKNPHFSIASHFFQNIPISGDFYDSILLDENTLYFCIGTVSNKSMASAVFMSLTTGLLQSLMRTTQDLAKTANLTNDILRTRNPLSIAVNVLLGTLDLTNGKIRYINAGHPELIHIHNGVMRQNTSSNSFHPMGIWESIYFTEEIIELQEGDSILLYTQGLLKAHNREEETFGLERLQYILADNTKSTAEELCYILTQKYNLFCAEEKQDANAIFLCLQYRPYILNEYRLFNTIVGTDKHLSDMKNGIIYN